MNKKFIQIVKNSFDFMNNVHYFNGGKWNIEDEGCRQYLFSNYGNSFLRLGDLNYIICNNADLPILRGLWPTIGSIELEITEDGKYRLKIFSMSQNPSDIIAAFEVSGKDFQVYRWVDDGTKDESGIYPKLPSLSEFIKWYEEEEKTNYDSTK